MKRIDPSRRHACAALLALGVGSISAGAGAAGPAAWADDVIDLIQARSLHESGAALLVDIREPIEHATGVAAGAQLLPIRQLNARLAELPRDRPVLLICQTQGRSRSLLRALRERGYTNLRYVHGGMSEWVKRGWPTVKPGG